MTQKYDILRIMTIPF